MSPRPPFTKALAAQSHRAPQRLVQGLGALLEVQRYHQKIVTPGGLAFNAEHPVSQTWIVLECVADVAAVRIRDSVGLIADAAGFPLAPGLLQCSPQLGLLGMAATDLAVEMKVDPSRWRFAE